MSVNRRNFLVSTAAAAVGAAVGASRASAQGAESKSTGDTLPIRVGMTDWNLGERGVVEKVELARRIGLDGIQVSILYPEDGLHLRDPKLQGAYRKAALDNGVQICSLAIGDLGPGGPFKSEPMGVLRVADAIEVAANIGTNDILLPFFRDRAPSTDEEFTRITNTFKELAPIAEYHQVVVGIESSLSGEQHLRILDAVASPWIGVYLDPWNCSYYGHDPLVDIPLLKDYIHQVHVKNGKQLMSGPNERGFAWPEVAELLYKIGYKGWFILETDAPSGDLTADTRKNIEYVRKNFRIPA
ncbi:MAG TPA: sugar phosphate isomerase/epimerase family protein [Candidatus Glassbacteria bacterium]|nr:sugar phosphate isomerase/epimerase family protein [Candidatus Glassbacteria bacterium]